MTGTRETPRKDGVKEDPGAAYLNRHVSLGYELEKEIVDDARKRLDALLRHDCHSDDWYSRLSFHGVAVTSKKEPDSPFCMTKGVVDLPEGMTMEDARAQFLSDFRSAPAIERVYPRIDPMALQLTLVTQLEHQELLDKSKHEKVQILWGAFYVAPLISDRDFCFVQHECQTICPVTGQTVFCSNEFSWQLPESCPDMQASLGRVRGEIQLTGTTYRPHPTDPNRLQMAYMVQVDPKGYLPASIVNVASISQAMNCGRTRDFYEHLHHHVKPAMKDFRYPLDSYLLPRRGGSIVHNVALKAPDDAVASGTKSLYVRLQAHSEHTISVQLEDGVSPDGVTVEGTDSDKTSSKLASGKAITFGGKPDFVLDCVVKVTVESDNNSNNNNVSEIPLQFTNSCWKKSLLCLPVNMIISTTHPLSSSEAEQ